MTQMKEAALAHQFMRGMRPDAHRFVRPDWRRHVKADTELSRVFELYERKYREDQLRDDHGRFADEGRGGATRTRLASSDKPSLGRAALAAVASEMAKRAIQAFRSENGLYDLFNRKEGTVSYTTVDGKTIFGSNSSSPTYGQGDRAAADDMRDSLIRDYPNVFDGENLGQKPNDALYHAETTALLRAARENGGVLSNRKMDVFVDRPMCNSCRKVLPYVGLELGNPTVTFVGPGGERKTMRDGRWIFE